MPILSKAPPNVGTMLQEERLKLLEAAVERENIKLRKNKNLPDSALPIQVIDKREFENHLNNKDIHERYHNSRYQLIVRYDHHYIAFDIDKRNGKKSLLCLDAVSHFTAQNLCSKATNAKPKYETYFVSGLSWDIDEKLIQKDVQSCSMFAFDHCVQLANTDPDFHTYIAGKADEGFIYWDYLPPNFLWNAQSTTVLDKYKEKMKGDPCLDKVMHNGLSFNQYVAQGVCTYPEKGTQVTRNESVNVHTLKSAMGEEAFEKIRQGALLKEKTDALSEYQNLKKDLIALKVGPNDEQMDIFLLKCEAAINQDSNNEQQLESLRLQTSKMRKTIEGLDSEENIAVKNLIKTFDKRNKRWTIGMDTKARNIETALMNVPIEERENLLQSEHYSVTSLLNAIASKRIFISSKITNEIGQIITDKAATSFKKFKESFKDQIKARTDVAEEKDQPVSNNKL